MSRPFSTSISMGDSSPFRKTSLSLKVKGEEEEENKNHLRIADDASA